MLEIRNVTERDHGVLRRAIVELQEHERNLHDTRLPGEQIAYAYLASTLRRTQANGALLVAEIEGQFAGFVAGWIEEDDAIAETQDSSRFAYVSDIFVAPVHRGRGLSLRLLEEIERRLAGPGVARLRIAALAANALAARAYLRAGFASYEIVYEKRIARPDVQIRQERPGDFQDIRSLTASAFADAPHAAGDEADFVERQRVGDGYVPALALVAVDGAEVVGHVMMTGFRVLGDWASPRALLLAIVSVAPTSQRTGVGSRLVREAIARARALGYQAVFVLGDPGFYSRFGFRPASSYGIASANGYPSENVMALEIEPGALSGARGSVTFPD